MLKAIFGGFCQKIASRQPLNAVVSIIDPPHPPSTNLVWGITNFPKHFDQNLIKYDIYMINQNDQSELKTSSQSSQGMLVILNQFVHVSTDLTDVTLVSDDTSKEDLIDMTLVSEDTFQTLE